MCRHFGFKKDYDWKNKIMILVNTVIPESASVKVYVNGELNHNDLFILQV